MGAECKATMRATAAAERVIGSTKDFGAPLRLRTSVMRRAMKRAANQLRKWAKRAEQLKHPPEYVI